MAYFLAAGAIGVCLGCVCRGFASRSSINDPLAEDKATRCRRHGTCGGRVRETVQVMVRLRERAGSAGRLFFFRPSRYVLLRLVYRDYERGAIVNQRLIRTRRGAVHCLHCDICIPAFDAQGIQHM